MTNRLILPDPTGDDKADKIAKMRALADGNERIKVLGEQNAKLEKLIAQKKAQEEPKKAKAAGTRHVAHAKGWQAICTEPDYCRVGKDVVAFDSHAKLDKKHKASPDVKAHSTPVYRQDDLFQEVQADAGSHVVGGTSLGGGFVKILDGQKNVKGNTLPLARHDSRCLINCNADGVGGAKGKLVTAKKGPSDGATASNSEEAPSQRSSPELERLKAEKASKEANQLNLNASDEVFDFKSANDIIGGGIEGIQGTGPWTDALAQGARGALGFAKDIVMGTGELAYEGIKAIPKLARSQYTQLGREIASLDAQILAENIRLGNISAATIGTGVVDFGKALIKPITDPLSKGNYIEAGTRGALEILTLPLELLKGGAASKAAKAKVAADAAKATADAAKAAAEAADAAKMGEPAATKTAPAGDGVHVEKAPETPGKSPKEEPHTGEAETPCHKCVIAGKPVAAITGHKVLFGAIELDFDLSAPLPLAWQRSYSSGNSVVGWLGQGWTLPISLALDIDFKKITLLDKLQRGIRFPTLSIGKSFYSRYEQITLSRLDLFTYELIDKDGIYKKFQLLSGTANIARLISLEDRNGNRIRIDYNEQEQPVAVTDSADRTLLLAFEQERLIRVSEQDPVNQASITLVCYEYDVFGDLVRVRNRAGITTREFAYQNHIMVKHAQPGGLVSEYNYTETTPKGRVLRNHTNTGQFWEFDYQARYTTINDNLGRKLVHQFDAKKRYVGTIDAMGGQQVRELDQFGNLIAFTDANGHTEHYQYDSRSRLTRIQSTEGAQTFIIYDPHFDKPAAIFDAMGGCTRFQYDQYANLTAITDALGQTSEYRYDQRGLPVEIIDANQGVKRLSYNSAAQVTSYTDCSSQRTEFTYDQAGNLSQIKDALGHITSYDYDATGRLICTHYPDSSNEIYEYDGLGRLIGHIDANGHKTSYTLDEEGRLLKRGNALGASLTYQYDEVKRLVQLVNENGAVYAFSYDALDRVQQEMGFDARITRYRYDAVGHALSKQEIGQAGNTITTHCQRDAAGRLLEKVISDDLAKAQSTHFGYDVLGRLIQASNASATVTLEYDALGQLLTEKTTSNQKVSELRHQYDALGNRIQTTLPNGRALNHLFYGSRHLHQINIDGDVVCDFERDANHREVSRTQGALTSQFKYDPMGRLSAQLAQLDATRLNTGNMQQPAPWQTLGTPLAGFLGNDYVVERQYQYDQAGNLTSLYDQRFGSTQYQYDPLGRILAAKQNNLSELFRFDPAHNLLDPMTNAGGRIENNQLTVFEDKRYAYDAHGNLIDKKIGRHTHIKLAWNAEHQLIGAQVTRNAHDDQPTWQATEYDYDPFGRRIVKRDAFGETRFAWDGNRLLTEARANHSRIFVYGTDSFVPVAQIESHNQVSQSAKTAIGAKILYFHTDHLGTPRELSDSAGQVQWAASYKAWGNVLQIETIQSALQIETSPLAQLQSLRFQGQYFDVETGLHYNRFRYFDPDIGRFVSLDPIGLIGGNNLYQYAPNPVTWIDPLGLTGNPATATHITYWGVKEVEVAKGIFEVRPYIGYASMQGQQTAADVLNYRYGSNFTGFADGAAPEVFFKGYGQGGKDIARGLEQRTFEGLGGLEHTANERNPVGEFNPRRDTYLEAADKHLAGKTCPPC